jgi:dephospho-CoA kinase
MALKVGITGGIGSGKTVVCEIFRLLGVPVFSSDLEARKILEEDRAVIAAVKKLFGEECYSAQGKPDRKRIASLAFGDPAKLTQLNAIIHPAVRKCFHDWVDAHGAFPYIMQEAAVMVESGTYKELDHIILVLAPEALRIERAAKRDKLTPEEVKQRSRNQLPDEELKKYADYIIRNDEAELLIPQVLNLHEILKAEGLRKLS